MAEDAVSLLAKVQVHLMEAQEALDLQAKLAEQEADSNRRTQVLAIQTSVQDAEAALSKAETALFGGGS